MRRVATDSPVAVKLTREVIVAGSVPIGLAGDGGLDLYPRLGSRGVSQSSRSDSANFSFLIYCRRH